MNTIPKSTTSPAIYRMPRQDANKRHQFYQDVFPGLLAAAKKDCARSQFELGVMYAQGIGVEVDTDEAFFWSNLAYRGGCADACNTLGELFQHGHGVSKDEKRAMDYYRDGHRLGSARSSNSLGKMYLDDQQFEEAMECFLSAVREDFADAYNNLGHMYENGLGVLQNFEQAFYFYQKATDNGCVGAPDNVLRVIAKMRQSVKLDTFKDVGQLTKQKQLGISCDNGINRDQKNMKLDSDQPNNPQQINKILPPPPPLPIISDEANKRAKKLAEQVASGREGYKEALAELNALADKDNRMAQYKLGLLYFSGEGVEKSAERALGWLYKAAMAEDVHIFGKACTLIVAVYQGECDLPADYDKAVEWCKRGIEKNFANAWVELGSMYERGYGVKQDYAEAMRLYREGANRGSHFGFHNMGVLYQLDCVKDGDKDTTLEAMENYQKAILLGGNTSIQNLERLSASVFEEHSEKTDESDHSAFLIGVLYINGWSVEQNVPLGFEYLNSMLDKNNRYRYHYHDDYDAPTWFIAGKWCFQQQQPGLKKEIAGVTPEEWRALAIRYMELASEENLDFSGRSEALYILGALHELDPSEKSQQKAFAYFERAVETDNHEGARNKLEGARIQLEEELLPVAAEHFANKDYVAAWNTYMQLSEVKSAIANFQLALMLGADMSEKNVDQGLIEFRRAYQANVGSAYQERHMLLFLSRASSQHSEAMFMWAERHPDRMRAADLFKHLVNQEHPEATYRLGMLYINPDRDVMSHVVRITHRSWAATKDNVIQKGVRQLEKAYELGVAKAASALGEYYWSKVNDSIIPSESDMKNARNWFQVAANAKVDGASQKLKEVIKKIDSVWFTKT